MNKLYLIDGMSLVFRAYFAMKDAQLSNSDGEPTGAIYGFINTITSFIEKEKPKNIAVAFDSREPTFRHKIFPEYKSNREAFPEDLAIQLPYIKKFLELIGITIIESPGFEADDIIGTLSHIASNEGWQIYCITADKDFYQLLNDNVFLLRISNKSKDLELIGKDDVKNKFGVEPNQVIDYLALIGDSSDFVAGVKGIGEKTAIPLIEEFGNIENIYAQIRNIAKERVQKLLLEGKESAFLSKKLVTIKLDVDLKISYKDLNRKNISQENLEQFFSELNFKSLREKWKKLSSGFDLSTSALQKKLDETSDGIQTKINNISTSPHEYILVDIKNINTMLADIANGPFLSVCVETDVANRNESDIVGIAFCCQEGMAYYLPLISLEKQVEDENLFGNATTSSDLIAEYILSDLQVILENPSIMKIGYSIKQSAYALKKHGINLAPIVFDAEIAEFIVSPSNDISFAGMCKKYCDYSVNDFSEKNIGRKKEDKMGERFYGLSSLTPEEKKNYFCEYVDYSFRLKHYFAEIFNTDNLFFVAESIEFPLIEVLADMEFQGINLDSKHLLDASIEINKEIDRLRDFIYSETNEEFNIDSPKQLADVLFNKMGLKTSKKNKTGYSTDIQTLTELAQIHPVADLILNYRKNTKLKNTYIDSLPKLINLHTQRIHTTFNQTIANTGRLSSTDPNLQNIPIRTDVGKEIRASFVAKNDDYMLMSADYSQIELRIMAYLSNDENLIKSFNNHIDIHSATASILFNADVDDVTDDMRRTAKTVNFGIIYGLGSFGLSQRLQIPRNAADAIIKSYFEKFSGIKQYISEAITKVRELGFAETMTGRRRYFPDINHSNYNIRSAAERAAINMPIQGSASDMIKVAMINIYQILKQQQLKSKMILQVHDELVFDVAKDEIDVVYDIVNTQMLYSLPIGEVPLEVTIGVGNNWLEAHS
jgi:DNA polymerase-1